MTGFHYVYLILVAVVGLTAVSVAGLVGNAATLWTLLFRRQRLKAEGSTTFGEGSKVTSFRALVILLGVYDALLLTYYFIVGELSFYFLLF